MIKIMNNGMMKRVEGPTMIYVLSLMVLSATFGSITALAKDTGNSRPNIVLILVDDMGPGEPSYAGGIIPTPAINKLAAEGMQFTDAHSSSAVCTPSRYSILTGRYPWRSWLKKGVLIGATSKALMDPKRLNLQTFLKKEGYYTGLVGKWHLGLDWAMLPKDDPAFKEKFFDSWKIDYSKPFKNGPIDLGFDEAFFILGSLDMPPYTYLEGNKVVKIPTVNKSFQHNEYNSFARVGASAKDFEASEVLETWTNKAKQFIQKRAKTEEKPFFLYLALTSPHTPVAPGKAFKRRYPQYSMYADFIAETDWVVEQVMAQLEQSKVDENTMVIFTSDNGFAPYVPLPKMLPAGYMPSGPYRGAKTALYEGGHRMPFLVRWPNRVAAGTTCAATVCLTDFFATFADILGKRMEIPANAAEDSFSFLPCLMGKKEEIRPFTINQSCSGDLAIRKGDWKLLMTTKTAVGGIFPRRGIKTPSKRVQLYNLKDDIAETHNLEESHPEMIKELSTLLLKAIVDGRTTPGANQPNDGWPIVDKNLIKSFPEFENPTQE